MFFGLKSKKKKALKNADKDSFFLIKKILDL